MNTLHTTPPAYVGLIKAIQRRIATSGLTHDQVATNAGMTTPRLETVLHHRGDGLTVEELVSIARVFGVSPAVLTEEGENQ